MVLYGTGDRAGADDLSRTPTGMSSTSRAAFEGVITNLERRYNETNSEYIREKISEFMTDRPCPSCGGKRLTPCCPGGDRGRCQHHLT